jgi:formate dehydrogenase assembly factor FdhD
MAVQRGLFVAQAQDVARHLAVVVLAGVFAAAGPGAPGLLAQVARAWRRSGRAPPASATA